MEFRFGFAGRARRLVDPIKPQPVQVNVQIRRRAKALDQRYRAGGRFRSFAACLLDEVAGDGTVENCWPSRRRSNAEWSGPVIRCQKWPQKTDSGISGALQQ